MWPTPEHSSGMCYNLHDLNLGLGHMEKIRQNCPGFLDLTKKKKLRISAPVSESLNCVVSNLVNEPICAEVDLLEENVIHGI